jgi:hypothetical protein
MALCTTFLNDYSRNKERKINIKVFNFLLRTFSFSSKFLLLIIDDYLWPTLLWLAKSTHAV